MTQHPVVFVGPSLGNTEVEVLCPTARVCPPAGRGDVLRACRHEPSAICLIDGYFEHRLAVHHKELLWAMQLGIPVYGAASMGALRAAELATYGMVGVGEIYRAFSQGVLEDDDEVAVIHGPGPGYVRASEPLVNIRATLRSAVNAGVVSLDTAPALIALMRRLPYPERSYETLARLAEHVPMAVTERRAFGQWLADPLHHVDQKALDARECIQKMQAPMTTAPEVEPWSFVWSSAWDLLWSEVYSHS